MVGELVSGAVTDAMPGQVKELILPVLPLKPVLLCPFNVRFDQPLRPITTKVAFEDYEVIEDAVHDADDVVSGYLLGQTLKYLLRMWHKGNALQDAGKASWYLDRLMPGCRGMPEIRTIGINDIRRLGRTSSFVDANRSTGNGEYWRSNCGLAWF